VRPRLVTDAPVWYVAYASNLRAGRLRCYLAGGRPPDAQRRYEGGRDPSPPTADVRLTLPGGLAFGGRSTVWGGALAFYDPTGPGQVVARAYRLTFGQLSDLVSQEARQPVGSDLEPSLLAGRPWTTRSGVYESLLDLGDRDGEPLFCLTSLRPPGPAPPAAGYLRTILLGLGEIWPSSPRDRATYLARAPGVTPTWTVDDLVALLDGHELPTDSWPGHAAPLDR
jgi:hypothetical protein